MRRRTSHSSPPKRPARSSSANARRSNDGMRRSGRRSSAQRPWRRAQATRPILHREHPLRETPHRQGRPRDVARGGADEGGAAVLGDTGITIIGLMALVTTGLEVVSLHLAAGSCTIPTIRQGQHRIWKEEAVERLSQDDLRREMKIKLFDRLGVLNRTAGVSLGAAPKLLEFDDLWSIS